MTENQNQAPALTLEPAMTRDKVMMEEAVKQLEAAPAAAAEATAEMDTSMLSEADRRAIEEFAQKIDLNNTDHVLLYGSDAQKKIADFSDSALATVRTNDSSAALVDMSAGNTVNNGTSLTKNHLYMSTIAGRTLTPTSGTVKLLIRGGHKIG